MKHKPYAHDRPLASSSALARARRFGLRRRRFLQASAAALSGVMLSNCRQNLSVGQQTESENGGTEGASGSGGDTLYIYTWSGYTDDEMIRRFTERTGIDVVVDLYDSNETMLARMQAGGGDNYSIIYPSEYMVQEMIGLDMLLELDPSRLQNMDAFFDQWQDPSYDPGNAHSVPFSWGTTGLLYNRAELNPVPQDWPYLWEYRDQLNNRMTLLDDMRETLGAVLKSLGYSINATDPAQIEEAYQLLAELKPAIANFQSFGFEDQILGGDLLMVMSYSSDAIPVTLEGDNLEYMVPQSGASLWTDTIVIPKTAPNVDAAYEWINYLLEPETAKMSVETLFFATPIKPAYDILSEELKQNDDIFPPEEVLAKCEGLAPVGEATELYEQYWTQLTSA